MVEMGINIEEDCEEAILANNVELLKYFIEDRNLYCDPHVSFLDSTDEGFEIIKYLFSVVHRENVLQFHHTFLIDNLDFCFRERRMRIILENLDDEALDNLYFSSVHRYKCLRENYPDIFKLLIDYGMKLTKEHQKEIQSTHKIIRY